MTIQYADNLCDIMTLWLGDRYPELICSSNEDIEIFHMQDCCFHYTTLDSFWKIVESETFRATHVRFSNDMQEYKCGEEIIKRIIGTDNLRKESYYVICFCSDGDLLSQWREYGKVGVSIEMDFSRQSLFSLESNCSATHKLIFSYPVNVLYVKNGKTLQNEEFFRSKKVFSYKSLRKTYKVSPTHGRDEHFRSIIPYIKNGAFIEEKESRLLFSMPLGEEEKELDFVHYTEPAPYKKPYLKVRYGDNSDESKNCIYIHIMDTVKNPITHIVQAWLTDYNMSTGKAIKIESEINDQITNNQIYISAGLEQKDIMNGIESACTGLLQQPKIWCDGHWPIRSIIVGPTSEKEQIRESIEHYCKSKHWLKYVDVKATETPYREKRN